MKNLYLILILMISVFTGLFAQTNSAVETEEGIYELCYNGYKEDATVLVSGSSVYIPLTGFMSFVRIYYNTAGKFENIKGYVSHQDSSFKIDFEKKEILGISKETFNFTDKDFIKTDLEVFVKPEIIKRLFECECAIYSNRLQVSVQAKYELPLLKEEERENKRNNMHESADLSKLDLPVLYERRWRIIDGGSINYSFSAATLNSSQTYGYSGGLGGQLFGGELLYNGAGSFAQNSETGGKILSQSYVQSYRWRLPLGDNSYCSQISVGDLLDISGRSSSLVTSEESYKPIKGIQISNENTLMPDVFSHLVIEDRIDPNWTVEVYVNNQLAAHAKTDNMGYYKFVLPVKYGSTNISLKYYGPNGEYMEKNDAMNVPSEFLPVGTVKYTLNAGKDNENNYLLKGKTSIGLCDWFTGTASFEKLRGSTTLEQTYSGGLRLLGSNVIDAVFSPNNYWKAGTRFNIGASNSFDVVYTRKFGTATQMNENRVDLNGGISRLFGTPLSMVVRSSRAYSGESVTTSVSNNLGLYFNSVSFSVNYSGTFSEFQDASANYSIHSLDYRADYSLPELSGFLNFFSKTRVGVDIFHDVTNHRISSINYSIQQEVLKNLNLSCNYRTGLIDGSSSVSLSLSMSLPYFRVNSSAQKSNQSNASLSSDLSGSLAVNPSEGSIYAHNSIFSNGFGYGSAAIRFYMDANNNGVYDDGEEIIKEAGCYVPNANMENSPTSDVKNVYNLIPAMKYNCFVKKELFKNPLIVPKYEEFAFVAEPNTIRSIDIPCYYAGIIEGAVYKKVGDKNIGQGGVKVHIESKNGAYKKSIPVFSDGSYYAMAVPPGDYSVFVDSAQMALLNVISEPTNRNITIKSSKEGDISSDANLYLRAINEAPVSTQVVENKIVPEKKDTSDINGSLEIIKKMRNNDKSKNANETIAKVEVAKKIEISKKKVFSFGNAKEVGLSKEIKAYLDALADYLKAESSREISIVGHTDSQGDPDRNQAISEKRAMEAQKYLIGKGAPASRILVSGRGDREPIDSNLMPEGRKKNRRIEILIIKQ